MTKLTKIILFLGVALVFAACTAESPAPEAAVTETEPTAAPIELITSFTSVGSSSRTSRIIAPSIEEHFQRPIEIIYNEGGRGGDVGIDRAVTADPDQLTLFVGTVGNLTLLPNISSSYSIDPLQDFKPISQLTVTPDVLIVHAGLGINNLDELVAYANASEAPLTYTHIAPQSIHRMEFLQILNDLGIEGENDESIRGSAPAMEAVGSGAVDLAMTTAPYVAPLVEQGLVVALAVANETRLPAYPDVPTMTEAGIAIPHGSWAAALVPAATSDADVEQMFLAVTGALNDPEVAAQIAELGMVAAPSSSPEEFAAYMAEETARLGAVAQKFNVVEN